ncbi:apical junction component 1 homolog [Brienomyrus brachyistius]|uniref:apical junction component 1 homolog n=1 Tax=Brienomyrus brachyistius TaxID=42636 RepID=UPI0020B44B34|nr:apical junction component 1 homolog [Brienomyrus brachyistius]
MTRTEPPDILASTVYRDIKVKSTSTHSESVCFSKQCDAQMTTTLEDKQEKIHKRHCRSFDFIESLDDPKPCEPQGMEHHHRRPERQSETQGEMSWNALGQQGHLRFSSPDLFNTRLPPQHSNSDTTSKATKPESKQRSRSKSAPRAKTTFTPVPIEMSPPVVRRGREVQRARRDPPRRPEASPRREVSYATSRVLTQEVHPIKLQPQRGDSSRFSPLNASDRFEGGRPSKPATSPHVKCRVDIKPDEGGLQQAVRQPPAPRTEIPWQRYSSSGSRGLAVPRQVSTSRTPTPSECYSADYRHPYPYSYGMPVNYVQPVDIPHRMPSPRDQREYLERERRAFSSPGVPTKLFYTEPGRYSISAPPTRNYYQNDRYSMSSQGHSPKMQYMHDPRSHIVHTMPITIRPYYTEIEARPYPGEPVYPRPYSTSEPGPYIIQTPPTRSFYGENPAAYPIQTVPSNIFYTNEAFSHLPEHHVPLRPYHTEGRHRPRMSQPHVGDWYASSFSGYAAHHNQFTPPRARPEMTPWYANPCMEPPRLGAEAKPYSKSWDNILNSHVEREQPVHRGRSYENLLYQGKRAASPDDRRQPVVVNLSSSPRRYAALSLSENSLEKGPVDGARSMTGRLWYVTPEITITDNDIHPGKIKRSQSRSASWDMLDSDKAKPRTVSYQDPPSYSADTTKDKSHNSYSLQQSLEQLDELLADLVIDYKPPASRRPSEDLLDQLKKLINEDDSNSTKKGSKEDPGPLNKQPMSTKIIPDALKNLDSCDGVQRSTEECSPEQSTDEDDTMMCSNRKCRRTETLFNACLYFKSCHSCYTYYCSRNCRREDWDVHKVNCLYGRIGSVCRHILKFCRENSEIHKAFSRIAKVGYLSRGRGVLFLGFPSPGSSNNFLQYGLESLLMTPTYLSLRELETFKDNLGEYCKELQDAGNEYDPSECFLLNVSIAVGDQVPDRPSPRVRAPTVRKYAKVSLASCSPEKRPFKRESDMETLILTPPPGTSDIDKEGEEGRKAREICFINIQRELRARGVFLRHEYPKIYQQLCEFVESNKRFTPTTIYPIDKRTGRQFMCIIMAASEPRTLDWVGTPNLLDDII